MYSIDLSYIVVLFVILPTDEQVHELFAKCGDVKRIIIGLDKIKKTACGFCFVEYPFIFGSFAHRQTHQMYLPVCVKNY